MVKQDFDKVIRDFLAYFQIIVKNLNFTHNNMIPIVTIQKSNKTLQGLRNVVSEVSFHKDAELAAIQDGWLEFIQTHVDNFESSDTLKELNNYLLNKVYFVGNEFGSVDILIYYLLYNVFVSKTQHLIQALNLSLQEKEKYINVSRWFNAIQHNQKARSTRSLIPFSRCCLYN
ncbi:hypothetical protein RUM44_011310 [Polyplax serrata]|uniref:Nuclear-export cofactor Arc1-like N-terminal domain-containing protein n=1 Tax=Polyplax serrata TaxID=468196 RepID=A0ABR1APS1_POLSC